MLEFHLQKKYESKARKVEISCNGQIEVGQSVGIYGKSGIGKSSILRMIAGLDFPDQGKITFAQKVWFESNTKINILPSNRKIGFVFQDYHLFNNMSVRENLEYVSDKSIPEWITEFINQSELKHLLSNYPHQLSGGERQRFSILRALCQKPDLLLLDEPFSALDDESIETMILIINKARKELKVAVLIVSHRKDILLKMTDSLISMN